MYIIHNLILQYVCVIFTDKNDEDQITKTDKEKDEEQKITSMYIIHNLILQYVCVIFTDENMEDENTSTDEDMEDEEDENTEKEHKTTSIYIISS